MLDAIRETLLHIGEDRKGSFAARVTCNAADFAIEVKGVGRLRLPVSAAQARRLCAVARPAPFGWKNETRINETVRKTWEIAASKVKIDLRAWKQILDPPLQKLRSRIGLPEEGKLRAVFDKMHVYERGHFFVPHQDSERDDDMVGTLVVVLPSAYSGGTLIVEHDGHRKSFTRSKTEANDLTLIAFYADCRHEVRPVESGYRITLTYHLVHDGTPCVSAPAGLSGLVDDLAGHIEAHFSTPPPPSPYSTSPPEPPDRLVVLLDHEYTQKSLGWHRLKNADRLRAGALREAAERLGCESYLALADVHESWSCESDEWAYDRYRRRRNDYYDDDDDDESEQDESEEYELIELIESEITLDHWIGPDGKKMPSVQDFARDHELCWTTDSGDLIPYQSDHEGWMGNYGNTVDRWYHRAAFVTWPREKHFKIRAQASPRWAVEELSRIVKKSGRIDHARQQARSLLPFWSRSAPHEKGPAFFDKLLALALSLDDAELATELLGPLGRGRLDHRSMSRLILLIERHGLAWARVLFSSWDKTLYHRDGSWFALLPDFCRALDARSDGDTKALARWLVEREVERIGPRVQGTRRSYARSQPTDSHQDLNQDLLLLFECAALIGHAKSRDELTALLTGPDSALELVDLGRLLRHGCEQRTPAAIQALGLHALYGRVVAGLESALSAPPRRSGDWSIQPSMRCSCELCAVLAAFLAAPERVRHDWPIAKERRQHVHQIITDYDLPVSHTTLRRGSPYTLVLEKQPSLFEREAALRTEQESQLAWLRRRHRDFAAPDA